MNYIHIGAGAGDKDPKANFRDGFTEYVKQKKDNNKNIFLIEANPKNIKNLKLTWKNYKKVKIINKAIVPDNFKNNKLKLYYSLNDAPHYQLLSFDINHVKRYFPKSKIKKIFINTIKLNTFLEKNFKNKVIESLSIDIEGLDYDVIMSLNLSKFIIKNISFEYLHLNFLQKKKIINKLINNNYSYAGFGIDHQNIDWLFTKKKSLLNNLIAKMLPYIHRKHYKRINLMLSKF